MNVHTIDRIKSIAWHNAINCKDADKATKTSQDCYLSSLPCSDDVAAGCLTDLIIPVV